MEVNYTATATRDGRWWVVQCDQHPGALSQVTRLDQAAGHIREAIAFVAEVPEDEVEVEVRPVLDDAVARDLAEAAQLRREAAATEARASELRRAAARQLAAEGLTVRDVGAVLGVSYQRAHQLVR